MNGMHTYTVIALHDIDPGKPITSRYSETEYCDYASNDECCGCTTQMLSLADLQKLATMPSRNNY